MSLVLCFPFSIKVPENYLFGPVAWGRLGVETLGPGETWPRGLSDSFALEKFMV